MDRGVSEMASMLTLVGIAMVILLAVGANVLFVDSQESAGPNARFTFDYVDEQQSLVITPAGPDSVPARNLLIRGPQREVLWSEVNDRVDNDTIVEQSQLLQIGKRNGYGEPVRPSQQITILYANASDKSTQEPIRLSQWNGTDDF